MTSELIKRIMEVEPDFKFGSPTLKVNYTLIPVLLLKPTNENMVLFNDILKYCRSNNYQIITRTNNRGISKVNFELPSYYFNPVEKRYSAEIIVCDIEGFVRVQFRALPEYADNQAISGHKAFLKFNKILSDYNIDLKKYAVENGDEINKQTEKYIIDVENDNDLNKIFYNAHHLDFHSSFPAGLVNTHPEFKDAIEYIYENRKKDPVYKAILNNSIGYMHSKLIKFKYSQLSKDAINDNNKRVREMAEKLRKAGYKILLYNTDGIWYTGGEPYIGDGMGDKLGQWENDHINCQFRMKSKGAYEFIEEGVYYPVIRGRTTLDSIKDRAEWCWGDIYKAVEILYTVDFGGIHGKEEER